MNPSVIVDLAHNEPSQHDYQLSASQQAAADAFQLFLLDPGMTEMCISGFAGSGKTYLLMKLVELTEATLLLNQVLDAPSKKDTKKPPNIFMTATTNKAVGVIAQQFARNGIRGVPFMTIHSLLGLKVQNNYKTGETSLVAAGDSSPNLQNSIIFVDEASMVDDELLNIIRTTVKQLNGGLKGGGAERGPFCKVIFIGDSYQLPPVGKPTTPVFDSPRNHSELTEIQRQAESNPIIQLSAGYRNILDHPDQAWPDLRQWHDGANIIWYDDHNAFLKRISNAHAGFDPDIEDNLKILAWTNECVNRYNTYVRHVLNFKQDFEVGDRLVSNKPLIGAAKKMILETDGTYTLRGKIAHTIALNMSAAMLQKMTAEQRLLFNKGTNDLLVHGYMMELSNGARVFQPADWGLVNLIMKQYAQLRTWDSYFRVKEQWADLRPGYALTCHKSQGSTYDEVFIDFEDIGRNTKWYEVIRLIYVGITRARYVVHIYGDIGQRYNQSIAKELQRQKVLEEFSNVQALL